MKGLAYRAQRRGDIIDHISKGITAFLHWARSDSKHSAYPLIGVHNISISFVSLIFSKRASGLIFGSFCFWISPLGTASSVTLWSSSRLGPGAETLIAFTAWRSKYRRTYLAQEEIAAMHPRSAEIRDRSYLVPVFLFFIPLYSLETRDTEAGFWKIPPHAILRWTTVADRSFFRLRISLSHG